GEIAAQLRKRNASAPGDVGKSDLLELPFSQQLEKCRYDLVAISRRCGRRLTRGRSVGFPCRVTGHCRTPQQTTRKRNSCDNASVDRRLCGARRRRGAAQPASARERSVAA